MRRAFGLLVALVLAGCGAAMEADNAPRSTGGCPSNASTLTLSVSPDPVTAGDAIDIQVQWFVDLQLTAPVKATLSAGDGPVVEVEVPLELEDAGYPYVYAGSLLNPFGAGAPRGSVGVIASAGVASGCTATPTAATGFTLE